MDLISKTTMKNTGDLIDFLDVQIEILYIELQFVREEK